MAGGTTKWCCRNVDGRDWFVYPLPRVSEWAVPGEMEGIDFYLCALQAGRKSERPLEWIHT
jgi:hypothetical protein